MGLTASPRMTLADNTKIEFPDGLPGFEGCRHFVLARPAELAPIALLESTEKDGISLPVLPVDQVSPRYQLNIGAKDEAQLGLGEKAVLGENVIGLVVLVLAGKKGPPTCNLMAPIIINPATGLAKQVVQFESEYSCAYPLTAE